LNTNVQLRIFVINTPDDLSPLKLRGWLLQQAREIQDISAEHVDQDVSDKTPALRFPQKKFDGLLQGIVDKFPAIHGIELVEVEHSLTNEEMQLAARDADAELTELGNSLDECLERQGKPKH